MGAAAAGNVLEWYDFAIYAYSAGILGRRFFPGTDEVASLLAVFATFGVGFVIRPVGGIIIGRLGDTQGRKAALLLTLLLMAIGTVGIGLLPDHEAIGPWAPAGLVLCRLLQGFSAGGEWGTSTAFIVEWAPRGMRGLFGSFQQASVAGGLLLGSVAAALTHSLLSAQQMQLWGWRLPFLAGAILLPVGLYLRRHVTDPPAFRAAPARFAQARSAPGPWTLAAKAC
ncbi:MAG TPA: MFS transporter, partial [Rhodopila sp.]